MQHILFTFSIQPVNVIFRYVLCIFGVENVASPSANPMRGQRRRQEFLIEGAQIPIGRGGQSKRLSRAKLGPGRPLTDPYVKNPDYGGSSLSGTRPCAYTRDSGTRANLNNSAQKFRA